MTDEDDNVLAVPDLYHLPARKKHPWFYQVITEPIDLTTIENRILSGEYTNLEAFEKDLLKLFTNVEVGFSSSIVGVILLITMQLSLLEGNPVIRNRFSFPKL